MKYIKQINRYLVITLIIFTISINVYSQNNIDKIISEIETNNTTLSALRQNIDVQKLGNKTDIYLQNPEVEFNYLFGSPTVIGNRIDFSLIQSFDFPTAYSHKNQISNLKNEQVELEYQKQKNSIILDCKNICFDLIYYNALKLELTKRLVNAKSIANAYKQKFDAGDINVLEFNKAQLNFMNITNELNSVEIERNALLSELSQLNGGQEISFNDSIFVDQQISQDFEQWYIDAEKKNPVLEWLKQEVEISKKQKQLANAMSLPKLRAGYMTERNVGQSFQGISLGVSIPLWENKNKVKFEKAKTIALEGAITDKKLQFYNKLKSLHSKAVSLQTNINKYRSNLKAFNNEELLKEAFDKGEISLVNYLMELSFYYEFVSRLLDLELKLSKAIAELNQYK